MTVKQAILSYSGLTDISDDFIEMILVDRAVDGSATYTSSMQTTRNLCTADCLMNMLIAPDTSEGDLSYKLERGKMEMRAKRLYRENGEPEKAAKLEVSGISRTNRW
ncbi:MAG: hypothetical protein PF690_17485 [Deltaproteobacteria bacterium]|jgi:hypothetical protein|nr:hypothetical protein [Deltaproteobacteria bacterium]